MSFFYIWFVLIYVLINVLIFYEKSSKLVFLPFLINDNEIILGEKPLLILDYLLKFRDIFVPIEDLEKEIYPACSDSKNGVIRFHIHKIRQLLGNDIILSNRVSGYKINI
jgi:DNA-binding response OmpR family regulator